MSDKWKITYDFDNIPCIEDRQQTFIQSYANNDYYTPIPLDKQHCWHESFKSVRDNFYIVVPNHVCCFCGIEAKVTRKLILTGHGPHHPMAEEEKDE